MSDLQHSLDLGRDVCLLVQFDAFLVGTAGAFLHNLLQLGQHHAVRRRHCLELVKQQLQQFKQQPAEGAREKQRERARARERDRERERERGRERERARERENMVRMRSVKKSIRDISKLTSRDEYISLLTTGFVILS